MRVVNKNSRRPLAARWPTPAPTSRLHQRRRATMVVTRSRVQISIEVAMAATDLPDPDAAEFATIKARLARAYLEHKAARGAPGAIDEAIVESVDAITVLMLDAMKRALAARHKPWLTRYDWFVGLVNDCSTTFRASHLMADS